MPAQNANLYHKGLAFLPRQPSARRPQAANSRLRPLADLIRKQARKKRPVPSPRIK